MSKRAYYENSIGSFLAEDQGSVLGALTNAHGFSLDILQKNAWIEQIANLKEQLVGLPQGRIYFEFAIPRMGKRVDVVLLIQGIVFVLEYKTGAGDYDRHAIDQVVDYALDLKNFHEGSHSRAIVPILVATNARPQSNELCWDDDRVAKPLFSNGDDLGDLIANVLSALGQGAVPAPGFSEGEQEPFKQWSETGYKPTPTIVEAAQALYQEHAVDEISRSDAGAKNLTHTADCISEIIAKSKATGRKSICFVTGVPGAGKTLAGLNISTRKVEGTEEHAVFLSGNGPLVLVLREALARDEVERAKAQGQPVNKKAALQKVSAFIQNIHHFRDEGLRSDAPPVEHVVVFDEAQRAWNQAHAEKFMVQKRGASTFDMSEPEFLISVMDRRQDWCTIVCLIGGGQEINTGEAGLTEWFDALAKRFRHWDVYHSGHLTHENYSWGQDLGAKLADLHAVEESALHLAVSIRSFRAEMLSDFVGAIIEGDGTRASGIHAALTNYPLVLTRDIQHAREWLRQHARGTERLGLVASSGAMRLKPEGIHVKANIDPANWFLNGKEDIRSSYYLEDVATEFDIQGLELDWTGVCWDADFRMEDDGWGYYAFKGTKWQNVNDLYRRVYLANAYRVLLTRARQGMVIFVPKGDESDYTRPPSFYDQTFAFLKSCGIAEL
jgi:Schlafen group 3, DNA/RNA helicase domain